MRRDIRPAPERRHHVAWRLAIVKDALPDLEVDEQPEPIAVLGDPAAMLVGQPLNGGGLEAPTRLRSRAKNELLHDGPEPPA